MYGGLIKNIQIRLTTDQVIFDKPGLVGQAETDLFKRLVKEQSEFDLIHTHIEPAIAKIGDDNNYYSMIDIPITVTMHNLTYIDEHIEYYTNHKYVHGVNYVFISHDQAHPLSFLPKQTVIYNGTDLNELAFSDSPNAGQLAFLGRITPEKGILQAIEIAKTSNKKLLIAAAIDHSQQNFYEQVIKPQLNHDNIIYLGEVDNKGRDELLQKSEALLFPIQWHEPFGLVMVESMTAGTPVIASCIGSVPEIVEDGKNGFVVPIDGSIDDYVNRINRISEISRQYCRSTVENKFTNEIMLTNYLNHYEKIMKNRNIKMEKASSEIRKHYFRDSYVIIAPKRAVRPHLSDNGQTEKNDVCHFCPHNFTDEKITYRQDNENHDWEITAVTNKFAAVGTDNPNFSGQAEVIIETRKHGINMGSFSVGHIINIIKAYIDRYNGLMNMDGIKHVSLFKNEGKQAGASLAHAHSQIMAIPLVPPRVTAELMDYNNYKSLNHQCPYCDIIDQESKGPRLVWEDNNFVCFTPYYSELPYETWLMPKRHIDLLSNLSHEEKVSLAKAMKLIIGKLESVNIPYNFFFDNAPNNDDYHTKLRITPRPNVWAGFELSTGILINPISPEYAAEFYKGNIDLNNQPKL